MTGIEFTTDLADKFPGPVNKVKLLTVLASQVGLEKIQEEYPEVEVRPGFPRGLADVIYENTARSGWQPSMMCLHRRVSYLQVSAMPCVPALMPVNMINA